RWCSEDLFEEVSFVDLGQSMDGGGGPACLRLRLPLTQDELSRLPKAGFWSEKIDAELRELIGRRYSTCVTADDLARIEFAEHATETAAEIASLLGHVNLPR
ncbi:MAG: N-succinylarginine dihydrolase, partial [Rubripirellula sp.]